MVFGLNSAAEAVLKTDPVKAAPNKTPIDPAFFTKAAATITVNGKMTGFNKMGAVASDASGDLFMAAQKMGMINKANWTYAKPSGDTICTVEGKNSFTKATGTISDAAGKEVGEVVVFKSLTSAKASLSMAGAEVYTAEKYTTIKFLMTVPPSGL